MGATPTAAVLDAGNLQQLLDILQKQNYQTVGPTVRDNAVVYEHIQSVEDLPRGWTDEQTNGRYRLTHGKGKKFFGYVHGPNSWKKFLYPPARQLYAADRMKHRFDVVAPEPSGIKPALIGVRACELAAIMVQDRVLMDGEYIDPEYKARRQNAVIVAVNCTRAGGTCFCASMNTGPRVQEGYDILLTEVVDSHGHYFTVETASEKGRAIAAQLATSPASEEQLAAARQAVDKAARQMGRTLDLTDLKDSLYRGFDSIHWEKVAGRCLTCGNCTMVCPTCFCVNVEDTTALTGEQAFRIRRWDSCFTVDFSYIHGGSIRATDYSRYRQWLLHKLAYWQDQFGVVGCVGCGRCITWCPVGIDITEEARAVKG
ncbi:4Fe-4S dicluster domain-containing protein [bacterium]|nr:4Fe-4S dicluster domain-containing protein [bacterium]